MKGCMRAFGVVLASLTLSVFAAAQTLFDNFESYDLNGEPISGTGGWYKPLPNLSVDWDLYLYVNASLITQRNPNGGDKVLVGYKPGERNSRAFRRTLTGASATGGWSATMSS
jgi:hypothetical protein